jgi:hypothetical protein
VAIDPAHLPYSEAFLAWLWEQKKRGRELWLVTGSDRRVAEAVADHLGLFDQVLASDGRVNLTGERKAQVLAERFAERGFVYAGNSWVDIAVWAKAKGAGLATGPFVFCFGDGDSALARLEPRVGLVDHEHLAATTHDLAVAMAGLRRLEGGEDLHGVTWSLRGASRPMAGATRA